MNTFQLQVFSKMRDGTKLLGVISQQKFYVLHLAQEGQKVTLREERGRLEVREDGRWRGLSHYFDI